MDHDIYDNAELDYFETHEDGVDIFENDYNDTYNKQNPIMMHPGLAA